MGTLTHGPYTEVNSCQQATDGGVLTATHHTVNCVEENLRITEIDFHDVACDAWHCQPPCGVGS